MKRALPWFVALVSLGGAMVLGFLLWQAKQDGALAATRGVDAERTARVRITELQSRADDLQTQLAAARTAQALAEKSVAKAAAPAAPAATRTAANAPKVIHIADVMKDHPEYVPLYVKQMRRNVDRMYGDGLDTLNLPPDQLARLKDLLTEKQMNNVDAQGAADAAGLVRDSPEWKEAMKQAAQETEQQIAAIVGPNANSTLDILQARGNFQVQVESNYKMDFVNAGVPLSSEQSSALVQALSDTNYGGRDLSTRPAGYNDPDPVTGITPHEARIIDLASHSLTPAQLEIVKADLVENRRTSAIMNEYRNGSNGPTMIVP
ncbi:MAG TPA: hypothetical protein VG838_05330 [Opitutaceae bacterium]|nr:hypothetical protein [Opitutaceae bacterium]